jgi:hypothetical protein
MVEMTAFRAVAEMVLALVIEVVDGSVEQIAGLFDLIPDAGKIHESKRGPVFLDQVFQGYTVESEIAITQIKSVLREVITLLDEVEIGVFHSVKSSKWYQGYLNFKVTMFFALGAMFD